MTVETTRGAEQTISTAKYGVTGRGGKGRELLQRGEFTRVVPRRAGAAAGAGIAARGHSGYEAIDQRARCLSGRWPLAPIKMCLSGGLVDAVISLDGVF